MKNPEFQKPLSVLIFLTALVLLILFGTFLLFPDWFPFSGMMAYDIATERWTVFSFIGLLGGMSFLAKALAKP
ncbi:MAG: hypothetical protein Q7R93_04615 [bacterium]|nr:hypothetical protein [bacterium]